MTFFLKAIESEIVSVWIGVGLVRIPVPQKSIPWCEDNTAPVGAAETRVVPQRKHTQCRAGCGCSEEAFAENWEGAHPL